MESTFQLSHHLTADRKDFFIMILMAICDARYIFFLGDIGSFGSDNDSGVFRNSSMENSVF